MKIAILVGLFPSLSQTFILNQIKGLIDKGHEVHIYALEGLSQESKVHPLVKEYNLLSSAFPAPHPPENYILRLVSALGLILRYGYKDPQLIGRSLNPFRYGKRVLSFRLLHALIPFLGGRNYDIIHCQFGVYGLQGMMLQKIGALSGQLVCSFRGFDISEYPRQCGQTVYHDLFRKTNVFCLANCEFFRQHVIELGCPENRIIVHGSGIDTSKFKFTPRNYISDQKLRMVTIGRLVEKKGIEYGIRAIAQLSKTYPNLEYIVIGEGQLRPHLEQIIQDLQVEDWVKLVGEKDQKEIISILDQAHLFMAPCVTSKQGDQDAPVNTLKEAMAMGLPVVSTWHGGIPELVEDGVSGFLVPERDSEAIVEKLDYLIKHSEQWEAMGRAGRAKVVEKYDMNRLNDQLVEIYRMRLN